jgi:PAS domain S-box-containing protein
MEKIDDLMLLRARAMQFARSGITITDTRLPDGPIIDCNPAFEVITGYTRAEVIGQNCRFLQNDDNNQPSLKLLREAIQEKKHITVVLRNYRKDGSMFWNELSISPIFDENNELTNFIGIQKDVTMRENFRHELEKQNSELSLLNTELKIRSQQQRDIESRINDLLKQSHIDR